MDDCVSFCGFGVHSGACEQLYDEASGLLSMQGFLGSRFGCSFSYLSDPCCQNPDPWLNTGNAKKLFANTFSCLQAEPMMLGS
jgi:hypothetical protein